MHLAFPSFMTNTTKVVHRHILKSLDKRQALWWSPTVCTKVPSVRHPLASPGLPLHMQQLLLALHSTKCLSPCAQPVPAALSLVQTRCNRVDELPPSSQSQQYLVDHAHEDDIKNLKYFESTFGSSWSQN